MSLAVLGIGTALPAHAIEQQEAATIAAAISGEGPQQQNWIKRLYGKAGVKRRHSVVLEASSNSHPARQSFFFPAQPGGLGPTTAQRMLRYESEAAPLAIAAARRGLDDAGLSGDQVTHLVTVSCSGFSAPGVDLGLLRELALPAEVARTHVGFMGCHGAINGLRVAQAFAAADPQACVLVCAVELCSLHHQYGGRPDLIVANALFADGAAAVVVRQAGPDTAESWRLVTTGSIILDNAEEMMSWRIGDHGFLMSLAAGVPSLIRQHLHPWISQWLARRQLTVADIATWAIHPGGPRILQAAAEALELSPDQTYHCYQVLEDFGNMSSPTVLFILQRLREAAAARPAVMLAFGPGLAIEAALLE